MLSKKFRSFFDDSFFRDFDRPLMRMSTFETLFPDDVDETDDQFKVRMDLHSGLTKDDIKIRLDNNILYVEGKKRQQHEEKTGEHVSRSTSYSSFKRQFAIPEYVKQDTFKAKFENGVLEIVAEKEPRPEIQSGKTIAIE